MKKSIIVTAITALLLTGCSMNKEDLEAKNNECLSYKNDPILQNSDRSNEYEGEVIHVQTIIKDIFYSPKTNSCLYAEETSTSTAISSTTKIFTIGDISKNYTVVYSITGCDNKQHCDITVDNAESEFKKKLEEYK